MSSILQRADVATADPASPPATQHIPDYSEDKARRSAPWLKRLLVTPPRWTLALARRLRVFNLFGVHIVARYDEVTEVLARTDVFAVPFGGEITVLGGGKPFLLGIDDREAHDRQLRVLMQIFRRDDLKVVAKYAADEAAARISAPRKKGKHSPYRIDAIQELITAVPLRIVAEYYGIDLPKPQLFADAAIDVSGYLFGGKLTPKGRKRVEPAAKYLRDVVDVSIAKARPDANGKTIVERLLAHRGSEKNIPLGKDEVRAMLIGMIVGFVPTNTMAGGHILEVLLTMEEAMKAACHAARLGDDDLLNRCLLEALRFMPINPGPFRTCTKTFTIAADTRRAKKILPSSKVLASTFAAMFDPRAVHEPNSFDPGRPAAHYLHFGHGLHWCVGAYIAQTQLTQTFKVLLRLPKVDRARKCGRLKRRGNFPDRLYVEFQEPAR
jgi:cytochrome P450